MWCGTFGQIFSRFRELDKSLQDSENEDEGFSTVKQALLWRLHRRLEMILQLMLDN
jgi:hypothetical protein